MLSVDFHRVSFDFDGCLSTNPAMQGLAKEMLARGFDVYILTARPDIAHRNYDLHKLADELGFDRNKILHSFTSSKRELIQQHRIGLHFDNDPGEVEDINRSCYFSALTDFDGELE